MESHPAELLRGALALPLEGHDSCWFFSLGKTDWMEAKPWKRRLRQDLAG
jgi:hypothetical protein